MLRKLIVVVASACAVAAFGPAAFGAGGATDIAGAPTLPIGVKVGHAHTLSACGGYAEFWRVKLAKGDQLRIDYGSKSGQAVQILVLDPSITDQTVDHAGALTQAYTYSRDEIDWNASRAGRYTIELHTIFPCQPSIWYFLTAHLKHATRP